MSRALLGKSLQKWTPASARVTAKGRRRGQGGHLAGQQRPPIGEPYAEEPYIQELRFYSERIGSFSASQRPSHITAQPQ